jgi:HJR/Mrr/RecB family endonuclease
MRKRSREDSSLEGFLAILVLLAIWRRHWLWTHYRVHLIVAVVLLVCGVCALVYWRTVRSRKLAQHRLGILASASRLYMLDPYEFEEACAELFRARGYHAEVTPPSNDEGIDVLLSKEGQNAVVQCKHFRNWKVGRPALQQLLGVLRHVGAAEAYLITSGTITQAAKQWAAQHPDLHLWDGERLAREAGRTIMQVSREKGGAHKKELGPEPPGDS